MHIVMISGSRNREGRTARALEAVGKGIAQAGGTSETISCPNSNSKGAASVKKTLGICQTGHRCIIDDDFASVVAKLKNRRCRRFCYSGLFFRPQRKPAEFSGQASPYHSPARSGTLPRRIQTLPGVSSVMPPTGSAPAVGVCLAGGGGRGAPYCCVQLERILPECGFDVVDMVPANRQNWILNCPF